VERGWSGANEHYTQQNSNIDYSIAFKKSADENVYNSEKERHIGFKKRPVFKIGLP
jgi:hypothetical protein